ncbi:cyclohexadienyl dehydrogenase [Kiloniella litopenaei]|uniref:prephenate dehydrogenase n=1 Tax=Kiloniella litopenaei TaxID=1549748 RepID=A0A0M2R7H1_9PROT|nr:prephenate/arogenate dehydrogenase family protein [Kiloniella litopenaei]KKJ77842.1 cyclohexadienyl dehydrogenase [Kiloniella litopenaei]
MTEKKDPLFNKIALVGIGLIGSSLARATRKNGLAKEIVACARSQGTRDTAMRLGLVDAIYETPAEAVVDADLVILCTPVSTYDDLACAMAPSLKEGAIVTDVGSVKESVIRDVGPHLPDGIHFVPGHPIAGTEHSGPEAGFAELFEGRWCILTPVPGTNSKALDRITDYWTAMGSMVEIMTAHHHDKVLAITSHLPHLIAYTIVGTATDLEETQQADVVKFSAGGFRDFTRIAASDPIMWRDVFLNNREAVLEMLQRFSEDLSVLQRAVRWGEGDVLEDRFRKTRDIRRGIVDAHQAGTFDAREPDNAQD